MFFDGDLFTLVDLLPDDVQLFCPAELLLGPSLALHEREPDLVVVAQGHGGEGHVAPGAAIARGRQERLMI